MIAALLATKPSGSHDRTVEDMLAATAARLRGSARRPAFRVGTNGDGIHVEVLDGRTELPLRPRWRTVCVITTRDVQGAASMVAGYLGGLR